MQRQTPTWQRQPRLGSVTQGRVHSSRRSRRAARQAYKGGQDRQGRQYAAPAEKDGGQRERDETQRRVQVLRTCIPPPGWRRGSQLLACIAGQAVAKTRGCQTVSVPAWMRARHVRQGNWAAGSAAAGVHRALQMLGCCRPLAAPLQLLPARRGAQRPAPTTAPAVSAAACMHTIHGGHR